MLVTEGIRRQRFALAILTTSISSVHFTPWMTYSTYLSLIAPFFGYLQYHLDHPPDGFRP